MNHLQLNLHFITKCCMILAKDLMWANHVEMSFGGISVLKKVLFSSLESAWFDHHIEHQIRRAWLYANGFERIKPHLLNERNYYAVPKKELIEISNLTRKSIRRLIGRK